MELGLELFVNSDWFDVGVVWVLDVYGCIEFFCFGIFHVHEVVFMWWFFQLDFNVDGLQFEYRYLVVVIVRDRLSFCNQVELGIHLRVDFAFLICDLEVKMYKAQYPSNETSTAIVYS